MADTNLSIDYYKLKVFLYKFTPEFVPRPLTAQETTTSVPQLSRIDRYKISLDEKFYTKYDITEYVSSYNFSQEINENTFDWSVVLHDPILTFKQINDILKVFGATRWSASNLRNLALYESQAANLLDTPFIQEAKLRRGKQASSMESKIDNTIVHDDGLRLSDLIQPYDIISVFLYKGKTPLEDLTGAIVTSTSSKLPTFVPVQDGGFSLTSKQLQTESILLSQVSITDGVVSTLFNQEFIGFVLNKNYTTNVGAVDTITVNGNGITRLFGATRRILKSSTLQQSIFAVNELPSDEQYSAYQNSYVGLKLHQIFMDLFTVCYRINFDIATAGSSVVNFTTINTDALPSASFYDISGLKVHNESQTNMFSIPPFLLALVMRNYGFQYRDVRSSVELDILLQKVQTTKPVIMVSQVSYEDDEVSSTGDLVSAANKEYTIQSSIDTAIQQNPGLQIRTGSKLPIYFSEELDSLRPYFKFFEDVLKFFNPEIKTPYEIIDELKEKTFLEFIDRPEGYVLIRVPQYNDTSNVLFSSTLDMISTSYSTNVSSLISRQTVKYALDAQPQIDPLQFLAFTDGKLLLQFGQLEAAAEANPNAKNEQLDLNSLIAVRNSGIIAYANYLLRLHNASLHVGTINCGYDPRIVVGRTFFDETANKFGYITAVNKSIGVGGAITTSFSLSYVRDAYETIQAPTSNPTVVLQFEPLQTILDLAQSFSQTELIITAKDPEQTVGIPQ